MAYALRKSVRLARGGNHKKAVVLLRRLAGALPSACRIQLWLANECDLAGGHPLLARRALRAAVDGERPTAGVLRRASMLQIDWGDIGGAEETLSLAQDRFPASWCVWKALGLLHLEKGDIEEALSCFDRHVELAPTPTAWAQAMRTLATVYSQLGNKSEAVSAFQKTVGVGPGAAALAYSSLIYAEESIDHTSEVAEKARELLRDAETDEKARRSLHYALGTACDRGGRAPEAFAHFHLANESRAKDWPPSEAIGLRDDVETRINVFTRERVAKLAGHGCPDHRPICIVGMPRSGTTLVEQIISSHRSVYPLGERRDISRLTTTLHWHVKSKNVFPKCVEVLSPAIVGSLARTIADQRREVAGACPRVTTKLPGDFWQLGLIYVLFPQAKFINCRRDPIDTCLSCYMQHFVQLACATSLSELADHYLAYERIMDHWRLVLPTSSLIDVSYETLLDCPDQVVRDLCKFCDLEFEEGCLEFYRNPRRVQTASVWQVRMPLYKTSVRRWERYREFLGPLLALQRFGAAGTRVGTEAMVDSHFAKFVIELATNPERLEQFNADPELAMAHANLTSEQEGALKSRDSALIDQAARSIRPRPSSTNEPQVSMLRCAGTRSSEASPADALG
jgi:tetratricopeptide (TPR) repeat protein